MLKTIKNVQVLAGSMSMTAYKNRKELEESYNTLGQILRARYSDLLDELLPRTTKRWDLDEIKLEALKYNTKWEFQKNSKGAYLTARTKGVLEECCSHMQNFRFSADASKKSLLSFVDMNGKRPSLESKAEAERSLARKMYKFTNPKSNNYDKYFCDHLKKISPEKYQKHSIESVIKEAQKHKTIADWRKKDPQSLEAAYRLKCLDRCAKHMSKTYDPEVKKADILSFIKENKRKPSRSIENELCLAGSLGSYLSPSQNSFDPEFKKQVDQLMVKLNIK